MKVLYSCYECVQNNQINNSNIVHMGVSIGPTLLQWQHRVEIQIHFQKSTPSLLQTFALVLLWSEPNHDETQHSKKLALHQL